MEQLIITALGTYYLTYALVYSSGWAGTFYSLRKIKWLPFSCFTCTAIWFALLISMYFYNGWDILVYGLASAGIAVLADILSTN